MVEGQQVGDSRLIAHEKRGGKFLLPTLLVLAVVKLWLVRDHEVPACDFPYDDPWYVIAATKWYWWGSYARDGFIRPAGYPLWIALAGTTGLPLRLSTELLFLVTAGALALSLVRAGLSRVAAALVFALIVFHPFSISVNDYVASESLYAPILLAALAGMVALVARSGAVAAAVTGVALGVLWQTREETVLVVAALGLFAVVAAWARSGDGRRAREIARDVGSIVGTISIVAAGVTVAVRTMNYAAFGAFRDHQRDMPGFVAAQRALLRITPERRIPAVGVSRETLRAAYDASPTFRRLQPYFEQTAGMWESWSPPGFAEQHEIAGRFVWPLNAAVRWAGHGNSAADMEAFCSRIAEEIDDACSTGRLQGLPARLGSFALVWSGLPRVPASLWDVTARLFWRGEPFGPRCPQWTARPWIVAVFDSAAHRRPASTPEPTAMAERISSALFRHYGQVVVALSGLGLLALLVLSRGAAHAEPDRVLNAIVLLLLGTVAARVVLVAVFEATVWPGAEPRALYPVAYLYPSALVVLIAGAVDRLAVRRW